MDIFPSEHKDLTDKADAMKSGQEDIRSTITDLEQKLVRLQELNTKIGQDQRTAERLQGEVIDHMAEILMQAEEQEKKSADLTLHTLKKMSDLIRRK